MRPWSRITLLSSHGACPPSRGPSILRRVLLFVRSPARVSASRFSASLKRCGHSRRADCPVVGGPLSRRTKRLLFLVPHSENCFVAGPIRTRMAYFRPSAGRPLVYFPASRLLRREGHTSDVAAMAAADLFLCKCTPPFERECCFATAARVFLSSGYCSPHVLSNSARKS